MSTTSRASPKLIACTETGQQIFEALFGPDGLLLRKTTIMVTSNLRLLPKAHHVVQLSVDGHFLREGPPADFQGSSISANLLAREGEGDGNGTLLSSEQLDVAVDPQDSTDVEAGLGELAVWPLVWHHFSISGLSYAFCAYLPSLSWGRSELW